MSDTTVDSRVVQFSFDNSKFESNVHTSLKTLDELKQSLNFDGALKGLEKVDEAAKGVNMGGLSDAIDTVSAKFSALQVVAVTALANITNSVVNVGKKILSNIITPLTQGGWNRALNIENAKFQLEGLGVAWSEIEADINHGVRDTAYGLDSAAKVAAQLVASQVQLGDDMKAALRGISGVASMTNSTYDDIGRIFTTVAGNGRLMGDQLLQLSTRGLNAASVLGEALGHTEAEIRQMVSRGEIDFNTFAKAMDDAFGQHAKDANNTFTGAMSNVKAALARIGANFATPIMKAATDVFNTIRVTVNKINAALQPVYDMASESIGKIRNFLVDMFDSTTPLDKFQEAFKKTNISWDEFKEKLIDVASEHDKTLGLLKYQVDGFDKAIKNGTFTSDMFVEALQRFILPGSKVAKSVDKATASMSEFHDVVQAVLRGDFGTGADRMRALTAAGYDFATIQNLVNQELSGTAGVIEEINEETLEAAGYTQDQIKQLIDLREAVQNGTISLDEMVKIMNRPTKIQLSVKIFTNLLTAAKKVIDSVATAWSNAFGKNKNTDGFYNLLEALEHFTEKLILTDEQAEKLTKTFEGLFSIVDLIGEIIGTVFNEGFRVLSSVLGDVNIGFLDITGSVGDTLISFKDWVDETGIVQTVIGKLADGIISAVDAIKDWIEKFKELPIVKDIIEGINDRASILVDTLKDWFNTNTDINEISGKLETSLDKVKDKTKEWFDAFKNLPIVQTAIENLKTFATTIKDNLSEGFKNVVDRIKEFWDNLDPITLETLKDRFESFKEKVVEAFKDPKEAFNKFVEAIKKAKEKIATWLESINFDFDEFVEKVKTTFSNVGKFLKDNFGGIIALAAGGGVLYGLKKVYDVLLTISNLSPFKSLNTLAFSINNFAKSKKYEAFGRSASMFGDGILKIVGAVGALSLIPDAEKNVNLLLRMMTVMGIIVEAMLFLSNGQGSILKASTNGKGLGGTFESNLNQATTMIIAMAGAVYIVAKAMETFAGINPEDLTNKLGILVGIAGFMLGGMLIGGISNRIAGGGNAGLGTAATVVAYAASIWIIVNALEDLASIPFNKLMKTIGAVSVLLLALAVATGVANIGSAGKSSALSKITKGKESTEWLNYNKSSNGPATTILAMAVSLEIIADVIKRIAAISTEDINKGIKVISKIMLMFAGLMLSTRLAGKNAASGGIAIAAISVAMYLLVGVINLISKMSYEDLIKGVGVLTVLSILIGGLIAVTQLTGKGGAGKYAARAGVEILAISAALILLVGCIWILTTLDQQKMLVAVGVITVLMTVVGLLIAATSAFGSNPKLGPIIMIAIILGEVTAIIILLEKMDLQNAISNAGALAILMTAMGVAVLLMSKSTFSEGQLVKVLVAMGILSLVMAALAVILGYMSKKEIEGSIKTAGALSILLIAMAAALLILSKTQFTESSLTNTLKGMTILTVVIGALGVTLGILQALGIEANLVTVAALILLLEAMAAALLILSYAEFDEDQMQKDMAAMGILVFIMAGIGLVLAKIQGLDLSNSLVTVLALVVVLEAMAVAVLILSKAEFRDTGSMILTMAAMAVLVGVIELLALILKQISDMDIKVAWDTVLQLSELLIAMSVAMVLLEVAGLGHEAALYGVEALLVLIIAMGALFVAIGGLSEKFPELEQFVDTGIPLVVKIAEGIGEVFGALITGFIDKVAESLPGLGESLAEFATNLNPFIAVSKEINDEVISGVKNLAEVVLILAASDLVSGIASLLGAEKTTLTDFGKQLVDFAPYVKEFSDEVKDINDKDVEAAANAALVLATVVEKLPNEGGLIGDIFGEKNFEGFGEGIGAFGEGIMKFQDAVKDGVDEDLVTSAANAGGTLAELESKLKNHGGWLQTILGDSDLSSFAGTLENFGKGIIAFQQSLTEPIDTDLIEDAATAGGAIAELENALKDHRGWWQSIFGDSDLSTFGSQLPGFGEAISDFQDSLPNEIKSDLIESAANAASTLVALESGLANHDGVWQMFTGDQDIGEFGKNLNTFGAYFHSFQAYISGISEWGWVSNLVTACVDLIDTDAYISEQNNNGAAYGENIVSLGNYLNTFGSAFKDYYDKIKGMFTNKLSNATAELVKIIDAFKGAKDADGISSFASGLGSIAKEGLDLFVSTFTEGSANEAVEAANSFMTGFNNALASDYNKVNMVGAIGTIVDLFVDSLASQEETFTGLGQGIVGSIANGMAASETLIGNAVSGVLDTLDTNFDTLYLPNAETLGESYSVTFARGVSNKVSSVVKAFSDMIREARDTLQANETLFQQIGSTIASSFTTPLGDMLGSAGTTVGNYYSTFYQIGRDLCDGLIAGIESKESQVARAARFVGLTLISELRRVLNEHSPSREAIEIGEYFDAGLAEGLDKGETSVVKSITGVGAGIITGFSTMMGKVAAALDAGIEINPTITPVLDLTEIQNGVDSMNYMLGNGNYAINGAVDLAATAQQGFNAQLDENNQITMAILDLKRTMEAMQVPSTVYNNTFNITGDDPDAIADEVSSIFQHDIERGDAVWA